MVTYKDVLAANDVLKNVVIRTPMRRDSYLSEKYDANIYLKQENVQKVRSFKLRGAYYAIHNLPQDKLKCGVVCASAGNHAQGVAYTCQELKIPATIFMPTTTPQQKITQVKFLAEIMPKLHLLVTHLMSPLLRPSTMRSVKIKHSSTRLIIPM